MNGIAIINKKQGLTSRDVVNQISKKLNIKKVGHTGTLDPLATGVLVVCIGKATKLVDVLTDLDKEYEAGVCLGIETDTLDITGNILKEEDVIKTKEEIINTLNSFVGEYDQEVPIYSAVKINGKKLYEYARENIPVELPKRKVKIHNISLTSDVIYKNNKVYFSFKVKVSKGTYIRSLIRDIADKLNTIGTMTSLVRTKLGHFDIRNSTDIDNLKIININECLKNYFTVITDEKMYKLVTNGVKLKNLYNENIVFFKDKNNNPLALYKLEDNILKLWKMF